MRAGNRVCIHCEVNHHMVQTLAEARLLHRQVVAQPMAIRMPLARRMRTMTSRRPVMIVTTICIGCRRSNCPVASSTVVQIVPATSKHRMDEQRRAQQAGKNGPHRSLNHNRRDAARFIPHSASTYPNFRQTRAAVYIQNSALPTQSLLLQVHDIFGPLCPTVN